MYYPKVETVFSALGDPTRLRIVERLAQGELSISEIASGFSMSQPAISKHVKVLETSGLLERRIAGRVHHCRLVPDRLREASTWLSTQERFWEAALDNLEKFLTRTSPRKKER